MSGIKPKLKPQSLNPGVGGAGGRVTEQRISTKRLVLVFNKMFGRNGSAGGERGQFESSVFKTKYIQNHQKIIQWKPDRECSRMEPH